MMNAACMLCLLVLLWVHYCESEQHVAVIKPQDAVTQTIPQTHSCLVLLRRQAPTTIPTISSTPRTPATTPPRDRPTAVTLMESPTSTGGRVTITAQTEIQYKSCYCSYHLHHDKSSIQLVADFLFSLL